MPWTANDLPDLAGRTAVVTGANSGIGLEAARELARKGARVVLACRDPGRASTALDEIRRDQPGASVEVQPLDLANLASVNQFAKSCLAENESLDLLVNNAGVMAIPRRETADGFEMQLGTNHLGHFALTGLLLQRLRPGSRVVNVSSTAHRMGRMRFDDLMGERRYGKWRAYAQSKLANLLFTYELQRRLEAQQAGPIAAACHPGYAATNLQFVAARMEESSWKERVMRTGNRLMSQDASMGALPTLYAAGATQVRGGEYIGPDGFAENKGYPKLARSSRRSHDRAAARRLWEISEELTGVRYGLPASPA
jgi:NAD(P)-dependent dehydrogenase (short-subunit alcohol dehydrogenase family)